MGLWGCVTLMVREGLAKVTFESCRRGSSWLGKEQSRWPALQVEGSKAGMDPTRHENPKSAFGKGG